MLLLQEPALELECAASEVQGHPEVDWPASSEGVRGEDVRAALQKAATETWAQMWMEKDDGS